MTSYSRCQFVVASSLNINLLPDDIKQKLYKFRCVCYNSEYYFIILVCQEYYINYMKLSNINFR